MSGKLAGTLAAGDRPGMGAAHHHAFEHGLAAHQGFLAAFKCRQELNGDQEAPEGLKKLHKDWMISRRELFHLEGITGALPGEA